MTANPAAARLVALDQFRGYTVLGMLLVNFVGSFAAVRAVAPILAHHHTYCSYADTIMPQFLFAVGFAFRLTFVKRRAAVGPRAAYLHALKRNAGLFLVAFMAYSVGSSWQQWENAEQRYEVFRRWAKQDLFQTLAHIAVTAVWVLPVIAARPGVRVGFAVFGGALHFALSYWFNYRWANTPPNGVDGGPLGFLTWSIPLLVGTLACDAYERCASRTKLAGRYLLWGALVMLFAYGLSCLHLKPSDLDDWKFDLTVSAAPPPLIHHDAKPPTNDLFTMSQRSGSVTYPLFGAGVSLVVLALFVVACDVYQFRAGVLETFGTNALASYLIHGLVFASVKPLTPRDAPLWYVSLMCALALTLCYAFVRHLQKSGLFLKL